MNTDDPQAAYTPAPAPLLGDSAAWFADVRRKMGTAAAVPAAPSFLRAADWFQLADVLDHAEAALAEATRELSYERQMRQQTEEALGKLAGRVKELQAALAEQEHTKLLLIQETHRWSAAVRAERAERAAGNAADEAVSCHGCGLPSYALKCRAEGCPAKPAVKKLAARVTELQAEMGDQEVDKLALLTEVQALRNANFRLEKEADKNYTGYRFS